MMNVLKKLNELTTTFKNQKIPRPALSRGPALPSEVCSITTCGLQLLFKVLDKHLGVA